MTTVRRAGTAEASRGANVGMIHAPGGLHLTTTELAAKLRKSVRTLEAWRYRGVGPAYIAGGVVTYLETDVDAWLDQQRRTTS